MSTKKNRKKGETQRSCLKINAHDTSSSFHGIIVASQSLHLYTYGDLQHP